MRLSLVVSGWARQRQVKIPSFGLNLGIRDASCDADTPGDSSSLVLRFTDACIKALRLSVFCKSGYEIFADGLLHAGFHGDPLLP